MTAPAITAIVAPDGNRVVGVVKFGSEPARTFPISTTARDWPYKFDRIYVAYETGWRSYRPHRLPRKYI